MRKKLSDYTKKGKYILLELPLYTSLDVSMEIEEDSETETIFTKNDNSPFKIEHSLWKESLDFYMLRSMMVYNFKFYGYCPKCEKELYFERLNCKGEVSDLKGQVLLSEANVDSEKIDKACSDAAKSELDNRYSDFVNNYLDENRNFTIELSCTSPQKHKVSINFHFSEDNKLIKYGQLPSIVEFDNNIKILRKSLGKNSIKELNRAIGLSSHGVGIGSFVYLRRIYESTIYEIYQEISIENKLSKNDFEKMRMDDKIDYLKSELPTTLVKNKGIYKILSKGIHELNEEDCLNHFDILYKGIVLILSEKASKIEEEKMKKDLNDSINKIASKLT